MCGDADPRAVVWHRVFYRNGKGESVPADRLARVLARKSPVVIYHELAIIHHCQHCGHEGPWTPEWRCYPVLKHHPQRVQARAGGADQYIVCSAECWDIMLEGHKPQQWIRINSEPRNRERQQALWDAERGEQDRKRELTDHRKVPMPEWLGKGFCKWCNGKMTAADKPRWLWHAECSRQYMLATDLWTQLRYLIARDGRECAKPGCTRPGGEVDHRRPLWSVRHLPAMIRRVFYGPANLWLLCCQCHAEKTAREAAERATQRRAAEKAG